MFKKIVIGGGTDGIGFEVLRILYNNQSSSIFYVIGRNFDRIKKEFGGDQERIIKLECDITNKSNLNSCISEIDGTIDVFINTIGTFLKVVILFFSFNQKIYRFIYLT